MLLGLAIVCSASSCDGGSRSQGQGAQTVRTQPSGVPLPKVTSPGKPVPKIDPTQWTRKWQTAPGTAKRQCVNVGTHREVRSGEFIVGNFQSFIRFWNGTLEMSKLYYEPLHPDDSKPPLQILASGPGQTAELTFPAYAWSSAGNPFYATGTVLPVAGTWELVASVGPNWGCFHLTVGA